jgi:hypothetical protein
VGNGSYKEQKNMSLHKNILVICLMISVVCLAAGYWIAGKWIGALGAILMGPAWFFARKNTDPWLPFVCLLASVGLAVAGRLFGASYLLMIFGSTLALAVWDLIYLDTALGKNSFGAPTRRYENQHIQSLVWALGFGLFVVLLGRVISIRVPFIVMMLLISLTLFALDYVWGYINRTGKM